MIRAALEPRGRFSLVLVQSGTDHNESRALLGLQLSYSVWPPSCLCFHPANKKRSGSTVKYWKPRAFFFWGAHSREQLSCVTISRCGLVRGKVTSLQRIWRMSSSRMSGVISTFLFSDWSKTCGLMTLINALFANDERMNISHNNMSRSYLK